MSDHLVAALAELTAKRDALTSVIVSLQGLIGAVPPTPIGLGAPMGARPPRHKRVKTARLPRPGTVRRASPPQDTSVSVREEAILTTLRRNEGVATSKMLRAAMPKEPTLTDDQRTAAFRNNLHRLKVKGLIDRTGDVWSLVGLGSERS